MDVVLADVAMPRGAEPSAIFANRDDGATLIAAGFCAHDRNPTWRTRGSAESIPGDSGPLER